MGRRPSNLSGQRFGRLIAIKIYTTPGSGQRIKWSCLCDCGSSHVALAAELRRGNTRSCGCLFRDVKTTHGKAGTSIYGVWAHMVARCTNPANPAYKSYGGRGILVCDQWLKFKGFYKDMGDRPSRNHQIDRIDTDGNYEPSNCRWATPKEQQNNRRNNIRITVDGLTLTLAQWADLTGKKYSTIRQRIKAYGWPEREAILT